MNSHFTLISNKLKDVDIKDKENIKEPQKTTETTPPPPSGPTPLPPKQLFIVFTGLFFGILMASLDQTIVSTALPAISSDLGGLEARKIFSVTRNPNTGNFLDFCSLPSHFHCYDAYLWQVG